VTPTIGLGSDPFSGARRDLGVLASQLLPTGTELGVAARSYRDAFSGGGSSIDYAVTISQSLLQAAGPALTFDRWSADRAVSAAARDAAEARQRVVLDAASHYFALLRARRLAAAAQMAVERAERLKAASTARAAVGLATQIDVMRAELLLAQSSAAAAGQRRAVAAALDRLRLYVGDAHLTVADTPDAGIDAVDPLIDQTEGDEEWERAVTEHRREPADARDRVAVAERAASVARWTALPDVRVNATYNGSHRPSYWPQDPYAGWRVGVTTTYALGGAGGRAQIELADLALRAAKRDAARQEEEARMFARDALLAIAQADETVVLERQAESIAERQLRVAEMRSERGLADNGDVIDAALALYRARTAVVGGEIDRALAKLSLAAAAGRLRIEGAR
jgi:outer membrane protein